jgi:hypothetical protein
MKTHLRLTLTLTLLTLLCGCAGYAPANLHRGDIRSVYVEAFDNETFRRGLEVPLSRAVASEIKLRTSLALAPRDEADSVLSGELVDFVQRTRIKSDKDNVLLQRVQAVVRFRWVDRLTGRDIVPPQTVRESARVPVALGESLTDRVFAETARRIVERMEQNW